MTRVLLSVPLQFATGTAEALKWLALAAMTLDHINTFALDRAHPALYAIGRIAFPVFALVLANNLARPGIDYGRVCRRLLAFGVIAHGAFVLLDAAFPLNVMFTFAAAAAVIAAWIRGWTAVAVGLFAVAGLFVDYQWPGLALIVAAWAYFRTGSRTAAAATLGALVSLAWPNGTLWALAALPVVFAAQLAAPNLPRLRWAFYAYYPAHLAALAVLSTVA